MADLEWRPLKCEISGLVIDTEKILPRLPRVSVVNRYADVFESLPPPHVIFVGEKPYLVDGLHTIRAAVHLEKTHIVCQVASGAMWDAIWYASGANARHGLPLDDAERRRVILRLLKSKRVTQKEIAAQVGVSQSYVSQVKRQGEEALPENRPPVGDRRTPAQQQRHIGRLLDTALAQAGVGEEEAAVVREVVVGGQPKPDDERIENMSVTLLRAIDARARVVGLISHDEHGKPIQNPELPGWDEYQQCVKLTKQLRSAWHQWQKVKSSVEA